MRNWRFPWSKGKSKDTQLRPTLDSRHSIGDLDNMRTSIIQSNLEHQNEITKLNQKIELLENKLKGLPSTQISSTQNQNLNNTVTKLNQQLGRMKEQKKSLQKTIQKIENQKTTLEAQVDRLKNQPSVPSQLGKSQKKALQNKINQMKNQNDRLKKQVEDLKNSGSTSSKTISGSTQKDPEELVFLLDGTGLIVTRKVAKIMEKKYRELTQSQKEKSSSKPNFLSGIKGGIKLNETIPTNINVNTAPVVTKPTTVKNTRAPVPLFNIGKDASSRLKPTSRPNPKQLTEHQKALKNFLFGGITSKQLDSIASKINKTQQLKTLRQRIKTLKENDPDFCAINLSKELTDAIKNNGFLERSFSLVNNIQCPKTKT